MCGSFGYFIKKDRSAINNNCRKRGNNISEQTQLTNPWLVAISLPIICISNEPVLLKQTVPLGNKTAAELSIPSSLVHSLVSNIVVPLLNLQSPTEIHGILPPQYSGWFLLGVCPVAILATSFKETQSQSSFGVVPGLFTERAVSLGLYFCGFPRHTYAANFI